MCPSDSAFLTPSFRYVRINEALAGPRRTGCRLPSTLAGAPPMSCPSCGPELEPHYRRVLETGESILNVEVERPMPADPEQMLSWLESFYAVLVDGENIGVGAIIVDVTQRKQEERTRSELTQAAADAHGGPWSKFETHTPPATRAAWPPLPRRSPSRWGSTTTRSKYRPRARIHDIEKRSGRPPRS